MFTALRIQRMRMGLDPFDPIVNKLMENRYQESSSDADGGKRNPIESMSMDEDSSSSEEDEDGDSSDDESEIPEDPRTLSIRIMDWSCFSAKDLLLFLDPFLPEDGLILSVEVYPKDRADGYHAVAKCDSSATADYLLNKSRHGIESEFERRSNKLLDFRCIRDDMEFIQSACDVAKHEPDPLVQGVRRMDIQSEL